MKQLVITSVVFVVLIAVFVIVSIINKKKGRKNVVLRVLFIVTEIPVTAVLAFLIYTAFYYHADPSVQEYLVSDANVTVENEPDWYFFDGAGEGTALIFYPGAKVEYTAYAPLMKKAAESGIDCFLVRMPLSVAFLDPRCADRIKEQYDYDKWYIAGHSLGGAVAAMYCETPGNMDGLIMLAAYSIVRLPAELETCAIYGSKDGCLNLDKFNECRQNLPEDAGILTIEGGNHAGFGCYGPQDGDMPADITAEEQQKITIDLILNFIGN